MVKIKEKPCKGMGKAKGFESCGYLFFKRTYGLCQKCYSKWLLTTPEGKEKLSKATLKATKPRRDLEKARAEKKEYKSLGWLLINTRTICHDYIKLRDKGKPCVSCNQPWSKDHQAGHWKKAELFSTLKFDERNIHNQCEGCNLFNDGNVQEYGNRIHLRIGREGKKELEHLAELDKQINFKWDRLQLVETRDYYKAKIKELRMNLSQ